MTRIFTFSRIATLYLAMALLCFAAAVASTGWIDVLNYHEPPSWAIVLAWLVTVVAALTHLVMLWLCHHRAFRDPAAIPQTPGDALDALSAAIPQFGGAVQAFTTDVHSRQVTPDNPEFERTIRELEHDLKALIVGYRVTRTKLIYKFVVSMAVAIVLLFGSLFLADVTVEHSLGYATAAYSKLCPPGELWMNRALEAFYYSVVTFATVGYGDITPISRWSRVVAIAEILTFALVFVYGLNFAVTIRETADSWAPENITEEIRKRAFDAAGGMRVMSTGSAA